MFLMTGSYSCGSSRIRNPSTLLVHSSLCGDAAESRSSSGSLCLPDVWFHPISGMISTEGHREVYTWKAVVSLMCVTCLIWKEDAGISFFLNEQCSQSGRSTTYFIYFISSFFVSKTILSLSHY